MNPDDQQQQQTPPNKQLTQPATQGTEQVAFAKRWLPRLIVSAIVINILPNIFSLFGEQYLSLGESIRNYATIVLIFMFLITIFKTISEKNNAKN
ncbi:MAG: hypothetical protein WAW80_02400 [Candidatus Saccharimonadales bacterium]